MLFKHNFLNNYSVTSAKMGVSVSHPLRRTAKAKYILTLDGLSSEFDGTEQFSHSSLQDNNKGETSRGGKGFSKRNEAGCLQIKGTRGNSGCPFDSLDTIDSRKSVPFAVLPENNTQPSSRSPNGEGAFGSVHSDGETISVDRSANGKVLFHDDAEDELEDESSARKCKTKLKERNTPKPADYVEQKVIDPSQGKLKKKVRASSSTRLGEKAHLPDKIHGNSTRSRHCAENRSDMSVTHEGFVDGRVSEQETTRIIRADSEPDMVCL